MQFMEFDTVVLKDLNVNPEQFGKNVSYLEEAIADARYPLALDLSIGHKHSISIGGFTVLEDSKLSQEETAIAFHSQSYMEQRGEQLWIYRSKLLFPATCLSTAIPKCQGNGFYYHDHTTGQTGYLLLGRLAKIFFEINQLIFYSSLEKENVKLEDFEEIFNKYPELNPVYLFLLEALGEKLPEFKTQPEIRSEVRTLTFLDLAYEGRHSYPVINGRTKTGVPNLSERRETYIVGQIRVTLERLISLNAHQHDTKISTKPKEDPTRVITHMTYCCKKYKLTDIEGKLQPSMQLNDTTINPKDPLTEKVTGTGGSWLGELVKLPTADRTKEELTGHSTPALEPIEEHETPAIEIISVLEEPSKTPSLGLESLSPSEKSK